MDVARASRALLVTRRAFFRRVLWQWLTCFTCAWFCVCSMCSSDEATIKYLEVKDAEARNTIIQRVLDRRNILISKDKHDLVKQLLEDRARRTAYNPE
jgi:hypothetical protein